jgi:hypothetical protein
MFEYINPGFAAIGAILITEVLLITTELSAKAKHEKRETVAPHAGYPLIAFIIAMVFAEGLWTKYTIQTNIALFKKGETLQCFTLGSAYLVSKGSDWKIYKDSFSKDSILLDAKSCEQ